MLVFNAFFVTGFKVKKKKKKFWILKLDKRKFETADFRVVPISHEIHDLAETINSQFR